jgi:hypothetical protein
MRFALLGEGCYSLRCRSGACLLCLSWAAEHAPGVGPAVVIGYAPIESMPHRCAVALGGWLERRRSK